MGGKLLGNQLLLLLFFFLRNRKRKKKKKSSNCEVILNCLPAVMIDHGN